MAAKKKIIRYRNPIHINIGVVVFFIIIIYVLFNVFFYLTQTHVAEYQVQQGTIVSNHIYQGIIVRDETVEYAGYDGYINYYVKNASKVSVTDVVCSIDTIGTIYNAITSGTSIKEGISGETASAVSGELDRFVKGFDADQFSECYSFYQNLNSTIKQNINTLALSELSSKVDSAEGNNTFYKMTSPYAGVITYEIDGYEGYTVDEILKMDLDSSNYKKTYLFNTTKVKSTDPIYKRVNSEDWNILLAIPETLAKELNEKSSVKIRFCKDDFTTTASCSVLKKSNIYYLNLSLRKAMVRYINERFVDIELVMGDKTGLKIPQSSITSKEFFTVPKEYFTVGADTDTPSLLVRKIEDGQEITTLIRPTLYFETEEYYYIDSEHVSEGDTVQLADTNSVYRIGTDKGSLIGVYNINKGYAVFKQINIIYENAEYAIIEPKTSYGISLYDHIALNAAEVQENQLTTN